MQGYTTQQVFGNLKPFFENPSAFVENWEKADWFFEAIEQYQILVVGAGGLGCQLVKNLALSGLRNIHLIDMDTIDLTNLNRQFLFRQKDIDRPKADVVAQFVMQRCPGVKIIPHKKRIQDFPISFYSKFGIIIGGLDNVEARKYLNNIVHRLNRDQSKTVCYYIDGATQAFQGQVLMVQPFVTSCYECSLLEGLNIKQKMNYCTIANTPRTPEHCIQYVMEIMWDEQRKNQARDNDNLEHMKWIYERAADRAKKFNIDGVTQMLTMGVVKNIIPAIASTNALIAATCTNQVLKILTQCHPKLHNYFLYRGGVSVGSDSYLNQKRSNCAACMMRVNKVVNISLQGTEQWTIGDILKQVKKTHEYVDKPFINHDGKIFMNPADHEGYQKKQQMTVREVIEKGVIMEGQPLVLYLTDKSLTDELRVDLQVGGKQ